MEAMPEAESWLLFTSSVALGRAFNLSVPRFPIDKTGMLMDLPHNLFNPQSSLNM